jgi:uncharacterized protein (UPF0264 family)
MKLLVSVRSAVEAEAALTGRADIIDAKEPSNGALGPVAPLTLAEIVTATAGTFTPASVALGDALDYDCNPERITRAAERAATLGATFVKLGCGGLPHRRDLVAILSRMCTVVPAHVIAVAYADVSPHDVGGLEQTLTAAVATGTYGVLIDTAAKNGPGLFDLLAPCVLANWVDRAHAAGLVVAFAGSLQLQSIKIAADCGADIAGVRGAACIEGRTGRVREHLVQQFAHEVSQVNEGRPSIQVPSGTSNRRDFSASSNDRSSQHLLKGRQ